MRLISSDTNVWIDFLVINRLNLPFLLPYKYIMYVESICSELLSPIGFKDALMQLGLIGIDITIEEFSLADSWGNKYPRLSTQDRIALAIAKIRNITLLTGDKALRIAAKEENVEVLGTIGILDELIKGNYINYEEYEYCISSLLSHNGLEVRLPKEELIKRLCDIKMINSTIVN